MLISTPAFAEETTFDTGNTAWILVATGLVLFMTLPGLALFYSGLVRSKNVLSILMQCFAITCAVTLLWVFFVYGWAFGDGGDHNAWLGGGKVMLDGVTFGSTQAFSPTIPETVFLMYQMTFAIITPALIIGGYAERMRFSAMLLFSALWLMFVYAPVCHWVWGGGWLQQMGILDYAGGTVVHVNAGVAALTSALVLGSRRGFPSTAMPPHNMTLTVMGAGMLWVGWFGFNAGSALAANGSAGMAMLVTHIAAAAGAMSWMAIETWRFGKPSVLGIVTGMVAGLGTITPASGFVGPLGGLIIGVTAGIVCFFATQGVKRVMKIDDSLDVFPVHGVGGMLGTLAAGIFADAGWGGVGYREGVTMGKQMMVQLTGVLVTVAWCAVVTVILLKVVAMVMPLRASAEGETEGLDLADHGERGYIL
ncbi:MAG: ammonium transporter [Gammaproteobacteria bacterium]